MDGFCQYCEIKLFQYKWLKFTSRVNDVSVLFGLLYFNHHNVGNFLSFLSTGKPFFNISFVLVPFFIYAFADSIKHGAESTFSIYTIHKLEMCLLKVFSHLSILSPFVK